MWIFGISRPIGGAVPIFGRDPQNMVLIKRFKFSLDWSKFGRDTASEPILGRPCCSQHHNFWTKINTKNLFSHFCAVQSKDHLNKFSEELDQFWRSSSEKTEYCTFQNGRYCNVWSLNVSYWMWPAWREQSGVLSFILLELGVQELLPFQCWVFELVVIIELVLETPKVGQITIHGHHYKCAKFHHFPMFRS